MTEDFTNNMENKRVQIHPIESLRVMKLHSNLIWGVTLIRNLSFEKSHQLVKKHLSIGKTQPPIDQGRWFYLYLTRHHLSLFFTFFVFLFSLTWCLETNLLAAKWSRAILLLWEPNQPLGLPSTNHYNHWNSIVECWCHLIAHIWFNLYYFLSDNCEITVRFSWYANLQARDVWTGLA